MALRVFDPCPFNFSDQDIRVDIAVITGERSLSGFQDIDGTGGGGIWIAEFSGADFGNRDDAGRAETLYWRAINGGMQGGAAAVDVLFEDRLHQPVLDRVSVPHSDGTPFSDNSLYTSSGADCIVASVVNGQMAGNAATVLDIRLTSERALLAGERFSYTGAGGWGWRAAETYAIEDRGGGVTRVTFSPPIRGGIAVGDPLDFDTIRCQMTRTSPASNALNMGAFSTATIAFQEDMRPPVLP